MAPMATSGTLAIPAQKYANIPKRRNAIRTRAHAIPRPHDQIDAWKIGAPDHSSRSGRLGEVGRLGGLWRGTCATGRIRPRLGRPEKRIAGRQNPSLQGQASFESSGHRHISGTGGQLQFARGAYASKDGKSFVCLSSTYERHGIRKSRIVLNLTPGNVVTTPRSDMMYVVTEFGVVNLKGKSVPERATAMISLAHPDFREGLEREAREHGVIPKGFA